jgi:hypothetical protein
VQIAFFTAYWATKALEIKLEKINKIIKKAKHNKSGSVVS